MQTALLTFATAVILAIVAAFAAPLYVDWTQWRPTFEAQAARVLGAPVVIRGPIEAELLPVPKLVLRDVSIGTDAVGTGVAIEELRGSFALGALIKGEIAAEQLTLKRPKVRLVLDATGKVAMPTGGRVPGGFTIAGLSIENGTLDVLDRATGRSFALSDLDLAGEVGGPTGPLRLDGEIAHGGARQAVKLNLGAFAPDGSSRTRLSLTPAKGSSGTGTFEADGLLRFAGGQPAFEGRSSYAAPAAKTAASPLVRAGWQLAGTVRATGERVEVQDLTLGLGTSERPVELTGSARLAIAPGGVQPNAPLKLELTLAARQLDLNALTAGSSPLATMSSLADAVAPLASLTSLGELNLSSDTVLIGGAPAREVKAELSWSGSGWQVRSLGAKLPGRSAVQISGRLPNAAAAGPSFAGDLSIEAEDLPALTAWAAPDLAPTVAGLPPGTTSLKGTVSANTVRIALDNLALGLGTLRLAGAAGYRLPTATERGRLDAKLSGSGVDLDALLPAARRLLAAGRGTLDVALAFDGNSVRLSGLTAAKLGLALDAGPEGITIDRLALADFGGLDVTGKGRLASPDRLDGGFEARLSGAKADGLAVLARSFGPPGAEIVATRLGTALAPVDVNLNVTTADGRSQVTATGKLGALSGQANFALGGAPAGKLAIDIEDGSDILTRLGMPGLRPKLGPARLDATLAPALDAQLLMAGASVAARGKLELDPAGALRPIAQVNLNTADLARLFPAFAAAADGPAPIAVALTGDLSRPEGTWRIDNLAGTLGGVKLDGGLAYAPDRPEPLEAELKLERWSLGRLLALGVGRATGNGAWPDGRFAAVPLPDIAGTLSLAIGRLDLPVGLPVADARLRGRVGGGTVNVESLSGKLAGGALSGTFRLARRSEVLSADGHLTLAGADLSGLLGPLSSKPPLDGTITLGLDLAGSGRTPALLAQSLAGQGSLAIDDFTLTGADPRSLQYVMLATERGAPPDARRLGQMINEGLGRGPLALSRVETSLSILNGLVRTGTARVSLGSQRFAFDGSLDLPRLVLDASVDIDDAADPAATAPPGIVLQWRGPMANPERRIDTTALTAAINMRAVERETKRLEAEYGRSPVMDAGQTTDTPTGATTPAAAPPPPAAAPVAPPSAAAVPVPTPSPGPPAAAIQPAPQPEAAPSIAAPPAARPAPTQARPKPVAPRVQPQPQVRRARPEPQAEPDYGDAGLLPALPPPITIGPDRIMRPPAPVPQ